jgi:hypothetical protein
MTIQGGESLFQGSQKALDECICTNEYGFDIMHIRGVYKF